MNSGLICGEHGTFSNYDYCPSCQVNSELSIRDEINRRTAILKKYLKIWVDKVVDAEKILQKIKGSQRETVGKISWDPDHGKIVIYGDEPHRNRILSALSAKEIEYITMEYTITGDTNSLLDALIDKVISTSDEMR